MSKIWLIGFAFILAACGATTSTKSSPAAGEKLHVVVTTTILADVVRQVAGDTIDMTVLMKPGEEPHTYIPTSSGSAKLHDAQLIILQGAGLEASMQKILVTAEVQGVTLEASQGLEFRRLQSAAGTGNSQNNGEIDPHVWFSVPNVIAWVENIKNTLSKLDSENAQLYAANAETYIAQLKELDGWIFAQVSAVPQENRNLVTNHPVLGYFAERYGFELTGAVYPDNPASEPSARELAALEDLLAQLHIRAIFTENTASSKLVEQVALDAGIPQVALFTDSLGAAGSGVETYLDLMRYDVKAIVGALSGK